jgi:hypothetical protein
MKIIITESQYRRLIEQEEPEVLHIPSLRYFNNDWNSLQEYLESEGNPPYTIDVDLDLRRTDIKSLGNLISVGGLLNLYGTKIKSLENLQTVGGYLDLYDSKIKSLGNLQSVGGYLSLEGTKIKSLGNLQSVGGDLDLSSSKIESLGNLRSVGGNLYLRRTPLFRKYSEKEIREMVNVGGNIYMQ